MKIKRCPRCGSENVEHIIDKKIIDWGRHPNNIECKECRFKTPVSWDDFYVYVWNMLSDYMQKEREVQTMESVCADKPINIVNGETSDGYHTFNELYDHRHALFIALMRTHSAISWRSNNHDDGSNYKGYFVAGMHLPTGDISYHLPNDLWVQLDNAGIETRSRAPKWDGHNSKDVVYRLLKWGNQYDDTEYYEYAKRCPDVIYDDEDE